MPAFIDLTGRRFGRLVALHRTATTSQPKWACRCDCGTERDVFANTLREGITQSCGCLQRERATTHGMSKTPEFSVWQMMLQRCTNPNSKSFHSYGGRGITVCRRWRESFAAFIEDMGPRPSPTHKLDRTDNDGPYSPNNCRWVTPLAQGANKRNNILLTYQGERLHVGEWCRRLGMRKSTLLNRLRRGFTPTEALSRPVQKKHRRAT